MKHKKESLFYDSFIYEPADIPTYISNYFIITLVPHEHVSLSGMVTLVRLLQPSRTLPNMKTPQIPASLLFIPQTNGSPLIFKGQIGKNNFSSFRGYPLPQQAYPVIPSRASYPCFRRISSNNSLPRGKLNIVALRDYKSPVPCV